MSHNDELIATIADKRGVSADAVTTALAALTRGNGTMAQFSHADFGGMTQWSKGGMSMVGDMFNSGMKAKLDGVMSDLAAALQSGKIEQAQSDKRPSADGDASPKADHGGPEWPEEFGSPSSSGSQNNMRYAFFPQKQRLIIEDGGKRTVYDTGTHAISGVSQQQSSGRDLSFTSQHGLVRLADLKTVA
ncbi:hypothetical protein AE618_12825 [Bosea vaviloviae]|uniref:SHOCT domain-containing protein n=1 Tax=Bosea vaviloviae TaxID=1526658 RepID=A0A0N0MB93_9HYPH|nr:hypothetical protein AE618_12825 [Bosea vaviloviae]